MPNEAGNTGAWKLGIVVSGLEVLHQVHNALRRINRDFDNTGKVGTRAMREVAGGTELVMYRMSRWALAGSIIYTFVSSLRKANEEFIEMEHIMAQIQKVMFGRAPLAQFEREAYKLARTFGVSAREVARAMFTWAQQGYEAQEVMKLTRTQVLLMMSANMSASESVDFLTSYMRVFNKTSEDTIFVVDKLMRVQARFAITARELAEGAQRLAPVVKGIWEGSIDEVFAYITAVKEATRFQTTEIGRALRTVFTRMTSERAIQALQSIGVAVYRDATHYRRLSSILADLHDKWGQLNQEQRAHLAYLLAGRRRMDTFVGLMENFDRAIQANTESLLSNNEALQAVQIEQMTAKRRIEAGRQAFTQLSKTITGEVTASFYKNVGAIAVLYANLDTTSRKVIKFTAQIATLATVLAVVSRLFPTIAIGLAKVGTLMSLGALSGPLGLLAGIVAVSTTLIGLNRVLSKLVDKILDASDATKDLVSDMKDLAMQDAFKHLAKQIDEYQQKLKQGEFPKHPLKQLLEDLESASASDITRIGARYGFTGSRAEVLSQLENMLSLLTSDTTRLNTAIENSGLTLRVWQRRIARAQEHLALLRDEGIIKTIVSLKEFARVLGNVKDPLYELVIKHSESLQVIERLNLLYMNLGLSYDYLGRKANAYRQFLSDLAELEEKSRNAGRITLDRLRMVLQSIGPQANELLRQLNRGTFSREAYISFVDLVKDTFTDAEGKMDDIGRTILKLLRQTMEVTLSYKNVEKMRPVVRQFLKTVLGLMNVTDIEDLMFRIGKLERSVVFEKLKEEYRANLRRLKVELTKEGFDILDAILTGSYGGAVPLEVRLNAIRVRFNTLRTIYKNMAEISEEQRQSLLNELSIEQKRAEINATITEQFKRQTFWAEQTRELVQSMASTLRDAIANVESMTGPYGFNRLLSNVGQVWTRFLTAQIQYDLERILGKFTGQFLNPELQTYEQGGLIVQQHIMEGMQEGAQMAKMILSGQEPQLYGPPAPEKTGKTIWDGFWMYAQIGAIYLGAIIGKSVQSSLKDPELVRQYSVIGSQIGNMVGRAMGSVLKLSMNSPEMLLLTSFLSIVGGVLGGSMAPSSKSLKESLERNNIALERNTMALVQNTNALLDLRRYMINAPSSYTEFSPLGITEVRARRY